MTDPAHPIHRGGTLTGQKLRDAIMQQTEVVGGPGILVNYVNGKVVVSLKRQVVPRLPGMSGDASDVFAGKIVDTFVEGDFDATYTVQNLAETLTSPFSGICPSGSTIDPPRCDGIINVTPYNRYFAGGKLNYRPADDLHQYVIIEEISSEEGAPPCTPPSDPTTGRCIFANGSCGDNVTQFTCESFGGTYGGDGTCCPLDPTPADYRIWFVEAADLTPCEDPESALGPPPVLVDSVL